MTRRPLRGPRSPSGRFLSPEAIPRLTDEEVRWLSSGRRPSEGAPSLEKIAYETVPVYQPLDTARPACRPRTAGRGRAEAVAGQLFFRGFLEMDGQVWIVIESPHRRAPWTVREGEGLRGSTFRLLRVAADRRTVTLENDAARRSRDRIVTLPRSNLSGLAPSALPGPVPAAGKGDLRRGSG